MNSFVKIRCSLSCFSTSPKDHDGHVSVVAGTGKEDVLLKKTWTAQTQEMAWILMTSLMSRVSLINLLLICL